MTDDRALRTLTAGAPDLVGTCPPAAPAVSQAHPILTFTGRERARVRVVSPYLKAPLVPYTVIGVRRGAERTIVAAVEGRHGDVGLVLTPPGRHATAFATEVWNVDPAEAVRFVRDDIVGIGPQHDGAARAFAEHAYVGVAAEGIEGVHVPFTVVGLRMPDDTALVLGAAEGEPADLRLARLSDGSVPFADRVWAVDADHALDRAGIHPALPVRAPVRWWSVHGTHDDRAVGFHAVVPDEPALDVRHEIPGFGDHTFAHEDIVRATSPERAVRIATERFDAGMRD
ncbi:hypothetical protein B4N89_44885 [Embleya scabrispora]|uniref:Uncharacterized protein n=1 Tax=Embleya scabrispora TaxID=159449 RepID=A0A1T3NJ52_9ACTN|nr:hypothetical protein [Embleya scabrispora]OPC76631.1 hypothetical protein B4N89_44885 [Embleya scabrispora]